MTDKVYHVLFVCTGNSARPTLADGLLNHRGALQTALVEIGFS